MTKFQAAWGAGDSRELVAFGELSLTFGNPYLNANVGVKVQTASQQTDVWVIGF